MKYHTLTKGCDNKTADIQRYVDNFHATKKNWNFKDSKKYLPFSPKFNYRWIEVRDVTKVAITPFEF